MPTSHRVRPRSIARAIAVALLVAGCGGGGATAAPSGTAGSGGPDPATQAPPAGAVTDACALLSDAEIEAATGFTPINATTGPQMGIFDVGCEWELDNDGGVPWSIVLGVRPDGGRSYYDDHFAPPIGDGEAVEGIGDDAIVSDAGDVTAVKGDVVFSVLYIEFPSRDEVAVELAREIAENLGA